jgi:hypothetical protein
VVPKEKHQNSGLSLVPDLHSLITCLQITLSIFCKLSVLIWEINTGIQKSPEFPLSSKISTNLIYYDQRATTGKSTLISSPYLVSSPYQKKKKKTK